MVARPNEQTHVSESNSHKLPALSVIENSLRRIRNLMRLQRNERLRHIRSLSVPRRIKTS